MSLCAGRAGGEYCDGESGGGAEAERCGVAGAEAPGCVAAGDSRDRGTVYGIFGCGLNLGSVMLSGAGTSQARSSGAVEASPTSRVQMRVDPSTTCIVSRAKRCTSLRM